MWQGLWAPAFNLDSRAVEMIRGNYAIIRAKALTSCGNAELFLLVVYISVTVRRVEGAT
jgi:hypothetical protein